MRAPSKHSQYSRVELLPMGRRVEPGGLGISIATQFGACRHCARMAGNTETAPLTESGLFCAQFAQPVFHVAEGAQQTEAGLGEVERGVDCFLVLLTLLDASQLLGFGGELGLSGPTASGAVAQFELGEHGLELLIGDLLF